ELQANQRLLLLSGTISCYSTNDQRTEYRSMDLIIFHSPIICELNSSSIAYTWADEDELRYLNSENNENQVSGRNSCTNLVEAFYPLYLGDSIEFTPRRHSGSMTRLVENISNLQFIPTEIDINNEQDLPMHIYN
ncbi:unnamed protein product, partial [Adineta ricciae]